MSSSPRQPSLFAALEAEEGWEVQAASDRLTAEVVFNRPLDTIYHYDVPEALREFITPGQRVRVEFGKGRQVITGYCVGLTTQPSPRRLKPLLEICDREPLLAASLLELTRWMAERYLCSWGQVLEGVVPAGVKKQAGTRDIACFELAPDVVYDGERLPAKQRAILTALEQAGAPLAVDELTAAAGCGVSPIDALRKKGLIRALRRRSVVAAPERAPSAPQADLRLNDEQQIALDRILLSLRGQQHETLLLQGVTGSGKTEVYIQAIREVVSYGRQAIVLVPEISLTPQTIRRFESRFRSVAVLHSHLSDADRHWHWRRIAQGEVEVIVGARSAIFAPAPHLGIVIIDEEHESTFKQQSTPRYHAREVARERVRRLGVPLVLGSATPTLESLHRAQQGLDVHLLLRRRVESRPLPPVGIVDTRYDPHLQKGRAIGRALATGIRHALREGGQTILFLNLRGHSPVLWCPKCTGLRCPDCDITLTWHRDRGELLCHSCEYACSPPERCPTCGQPGLRYIGTGTQRLEDEVRALAPQARVLRMDSDSMRKPGSHDAALDAFRHGEVDILLGTQMIAKGLDFPNVTLVGIVDADTLLHQPDLRATERTFQLIAQVSGRTGRGVKGGRVLLQTMTPEEPVIQFAARHDYEAFAAAELEQRRAAHAPPFATLARVVLRSLQDQLAQAEARRIAAVVRGVCEAIGADVRVLGPAPAPILRLRKFFRYHFQLSAPHVEAIQQVWSRVSSKLEVHPDVELMLDVDPVDLR